MYFLWCDILLCQDVPVLICNMVYTLCYRIHISYSLLNLNTCSCVQRFTDRTHSCILCSVRNLMCNWWMFPLHDHISNCTLCYVYIYAEILFIFVVRIIYKLLCHWCLKVNLYQDLISICLICNMLTFLYRLQFLYGL